MSTDSISPHLPDYNIFMEATAPLALPVSASELHGVMCGYLCAGATRDGEAYLRALMTSQPEQAKRAATVALFGVYAVSHQQLVNFDFEFQLLLPDEQEPLTYRARLFSEWCDGFTQGLRMAGVDIDELQEEEAQDAMQHLLEFAQLDYEALQTDEEDERALLDVCEYARLAVIHIYSDLQNTKSGSDSGMAH